MASCLDRLLQARVRRTSPNRDVKVLTDWNGLMISALAEAAATFRQPKWLQAAKRAFSAVSENLRPDGGLRHAIYDDSLSRPAYLDDYAYMSRAAVALFSVTGKEDYLTKAEYFTNMAISDYWDSRDQGFFYTVEEATDMIVRFRIAEDTATPSGNAVMVDVMARLYFLTGKSDYRVRAEAVIDAFPSRANSDVIDSTALLDATETLRGGVQVTVIGDPDHNATIDFRDTAYAAPIANMIFSIVRPNCPLPVSHPAYGKESLNGRPTAYICIGTTCSMPITTPAAMFSASGKPAANVSGHGNE